MGLGSTRALCGRKYLHAAPAAGAGGDSFGNCARRYRSVVRRARPGGARRRSDAPACGLGLKCGLRGGGGGVAGLGGGPEAGRTRDAHARRGELLHLDDRRRSAMRASMDYALRRADRARPRARDDGLGDAHLRGGGHARRRSRLGVVAKRGHERRGVRGDYVGGRRGRARRARGLARHRARGGDAISRKHRCGRGAAAAVDRGVRARIAYRTAGERYTHSTVRPIAHGRLRLVGRGRDGAGRCASYGAACRRGVVAI